MSFWENFRKQSKNNIHTDTVEYNNSLNLTPRENDVFQLLLEGYTLAETANQLDIKYSTANTHMTAIYKKLQVNSRAELIIRYRNFSNKKK